MGATGLPQRSFAYQFDRPLTPGEEAGLRRLVYDPDAYRAECRRLGGYEVAATDPRGEVGPSPLRALYPAWASAPPDTPGP